MNIHQVCICSWSAERLPTCYVPTLVHAHGSLPATSQCLFHLLQSHIDKKPLICLEVLPLTLCINYTTLEVSEHGV